MVVARTGMRQGALLAAALAVATALAALPGPAGAQEAPAPSLDVPRLAGRDRVETAVAVSRSVFHAADVALLARADDFADALVAAPLAAQVRGPILLTDRAALSPATGEELERLGVREVIVLGGAAGISPAVDDSLRAGGLAVRRIAGRDRYATAAAVAAALDADASTVYLATGQAFTDALAAGPLAAAGGHPILLSRRAELPPATRDALDALQPGRVVLLGGPAALTPEVEEAAGALAPTERLAGTTRFGTAGLAFDAALAAGADVADLWLADGRRFPDALVAGPIVAAKGGALLLVDGTHLAGQPDAYVRLRVHRERLRRLTLLGGPVAITADAAHQLHGIAFGHELPRGGRLLFPQHRMVALYGNGRSARMGALGEQPPDQAAQRTIHQAAPYDRPGRTLLPAFELIVTVAQRDPGPDGLHRSPSPPEEVQPWLDAARRHGLYLFLDIQPGYSDFLTEVRRYDRFLREPDVGVALDPEWRMHSGAAPGEEVGHVTAAEVNQVVDYLAAIVREHHLPQKLLVVHQFENQMVRDRDQIRTPDELAVTFHADGFGSRAAKLSKYHQLLAPPPRSMGFKLFYDEDVHLFQPHEVLQFDRPPDLITYQ